MILACGFALTTLLVLPLVILLTNHVAPTSREIGFVAPTIEARKAFTLTLLLVALGILGTFPPFWALLG